MVGVVALILLEFGFRFFHALNECADIHAQLIAEQLEVFDEAVELLDVIDIRSSSWSNNERR